MNISQNIEILNKFYIYDSFKTLQNAFKHLFQIKIYERIKIYLQYNTFTTNPEHQYTAHHIIDMNYPFVTVRSLLFLLRPRLPACK